MVRVEKAEVHRHQVRSMPIGWSRSSCFSLATERRGGKRAPVGFGGSGCDWPLRTRTRATGLALVRNGVWALCFLAAGVWPRAAEVQSACNRCLVPWFVAPQDTDSALSFPDGGFAFTATGIAVKLNDAGLVKLCCNLCQNAGE